MKKILKNKCVLVAALALACAFAKAGPPRGFLETVHKHITRCSTVSDSGDLNPYAIVVAPVSAGKIHQGDVLIGNFNNMSNLQGTGTTIMKFDPSSRKMSVFTRVQPHSSIWPGGVGLTTAMTMLKSGWIIVGSLPSKDGTTRTISPGCLFVIDANGNPVAAWTGPNINGPWGNMATIDNGNSAQLFISMAGFDLQGPDVKDANGYPVTIKKAKIVRLDVDIPTGQPPVIKKQTVIGDGFTQRADRDSFLIGPTGLALGSDHTTLYASDALANQIVAIDNAPSRTDSAGTGQSVSKDGLLKHPLSLAFAPNGHLLTCNGSNGQIVELDPATGKQLYAQWVDADQAQNPPGNGDLFGFAMTPDGKGFYYVEDDVNALVEATH